VSGVGGYSAVVGFTPVPRTLRVLVCERDALRLVNVPRNLRFLVCGRIAERFVNAVNGGTLSLVQVARFLYSELTMKLAVSTVRGLRSL